jgi:predicted ATPase/DNA-binding winged helix-turn-helix (wHTH) protein
MLARQHHSTSEPTVPLRAIPSRIQSLQAKGAANGREGSKLAGESSSKPFDQSSVISFGEFKLHPNKQLLLKANEPVQIGGRAFDILLALVERAGQLVAKDDLIARAWPDTIVDQASLRVHMAAVRRALGDNQTDDRYVATIPGRGYRFVIPVSYQAQTEIASSIVQPLEPLPTHRIVGRGDFVADILAHLDERRFITIVGSGGIGKTTVALAIAKFRSSLNEAICHVDFAQLADATLVVPKLAASLKIPLSSHDSISSLVSWLQRRQVLLIFDNCEHLATAVAALAEKLMESAPSIQILATSREPLRARGESLTQLRPLAVPQFTTGLRAADAINYPAVRLFVQCAAAFSESFELSDGNAEPVAEVCQRLDGIPLAIELAARRIEALGLSGLSAILSDRLDILTQGWRTALPRHQSLRANFDWSYELLPECERDVLCGLANFTNDFTLDSAVTMMGDNNFDPVLVIEAIANLVAKSLIWTEWQRSDMSYRLPLGIRAYALEKFSTRRGGETPESALSCTALR